MEILRFENAPTRKSRNKSSVKGLAGLATVAAIAVLGSTLAANISLNSGGTLEFGQGVSQTTACDGDGISVTPTAEFANTSGAGSFNFKTVVLSGISAACQGKLFTINAYGDSSSSAVNLISGVSTATISWSTVSANRTTTAGMSLGGSATDGTTLTFTSPVATSGAIYKLTLQSQ